MNRLEPKSKIVFNDCKNPQDTMTIQSNYNTRIEGLYIEITEEGIFTLGIGLTTEDALKLAEIINNTFKKNNHDRKRKNKG